MELKKWGAVAGMRGVCLLITLLLCCVEQGCTAYHADPLTPAITATSQKDMARIRVDPATMPLPELAAHRFDASDGFDIDEVAMLAVANNPDLKLARDDLGIAQAQAFSAGLLPDPQLSVSTDYPGQAGFQRAFSYGLSMDVMAIVTRSANARSAQATAQKIDLGLLWQEWQVVSQAKQLFLKVQLQGQVLPMLKREHELAQWRWRQMSAAQRDGNLTGDATAAALTAAMDAGKQYADAQRAARQSIHDLNALLGLAPDVALPLHEAEAVAPIDDVTVKAALADLPRRRPDLIALQAGYEAQEQKYRAAILNQFPSLSVGFVRARDTSEIYTSGFQINLTLPVFNRNRGNVAIESATRQRLRDEYQIRLNQAYAEVARLNEDSAMLAGQLAEARAALPGVERAAQEETAAFGDRNTPMGPYVDAQMTALSKQVDIAALTESLAETRIALQTVLGSAIARANDQETP